MKVLHLIKTSKGAAWAFNFLKDLKASHPEIKFYVIVPSGGRFFHDYKDFCEEVHDLDFNLNIEFFKNGKKLKQIVGKISPDIIHSWFTQTTLYARIFLRSLDVPRIFQVVGPLHLENTLFKYADIFSSNKNDYWVATSKYILNKYTDAGISKKRIHLNYAYIDIIKLLEQGNKAKPIDYHQKFNLPENTKILGTASYIYTPKPFQKSGIKGHEFLIKAFSELLKSRDDIFLIIAGEPFTENQEYYRKLKKMAESSCKGKVAFTGKYTDIGSVIGNFDIFVYLSKSENLGGVYESLLFKTPTLSSKSGGLPELVLNDITGFTVKYDDTSNISRKMNFMLEKDFSEMKEKGKERVLSVFNKEKILSQGYQIYKKIQNEYI